ncbi:ABC transporter substrate-binding protein [Pontibacterium sp.]|uniref:ABC transporter substrate-binding protein n=2 Tax=Pontibacterium sp. TaxID=2036026 RepID=UPI003518C187
MTSCSYSNGKIKMTSSIRYLASFIALLFSSSVWAMSVTFVNPGKEGERFWDMVTETMRAAATDFGIELEVIYAQRNRVRMAEQGVAVTQRQTPPDYLILVNEEQAAEKILLAASQKQIRTLMLLNDFLPEQRTRVGLPGGVHKNLLGAITPDNFGAGERMMTALHRCVEQSKMQPPYHFLAIGGDKLTPASIDRNGGALSVVDNHKNEIKLDRFLYANWNRSEAKALTHSYLQWAERNQITPAAIWSANDPIAFGARDALQENGLQAGKDVCMVGLNWSAEALQLVRSGELLLSDGGHFLAGAWSMVALKDYHARLQQGDDQPIGSVRFQMQSIDATNVDQYLNRLGDENWGKIDFNRFLLGDSSKNHDYDFSLKHVFNSINH